MSARILIIAEHDDGKLNPSTAKTVRCASDIGDDIHIAVFARDGNAVSTAAAGLENVSKVLNVEHDANAKPLAAALAPQIAALAGDYTHVLAPSTMFGKDVLPRAAGLLGVPMVSDIMDVIDAQTFQRPIYAGNVLVKVRAPADSVIVGTVRTASYQPVAQSGRNAPVESVTPNVELPRHTRYVRLESHKSDRPDLQSAARVVSGGRGVGSKENFAIIFKLADKLGAAVGASRAAVDAGFVPNDMQVGQTGKIIAPELYFAIGISGAIQHLTGIKDARTIVAINKDPDAPIFDIADIGLVGDLFEILPELEKALDAGKS